MKVTENAFSKQQVSDEQVSPIRIVLPLKDQKSANAVTHQISDLSRKIYAIVQPVYTSLKIKGQSKPNDRDKPPIVNQQNVVYYYKYGLCDADYVGFTMSASRVFHVKDEHGKNPETIGSPFRILEKCHRKLGCLIFKILSERD